MLIGKEATNNPIEMVMIATPTKAGPNNTNLAFRSPMSSNMHLNNDDDNSEQKLSHQDDDLNSPIAVLFQDKPRKSRFNFASPRVRKSPRKKQPSPAITSIAYHRYKCSKRRNAACVEGKAIEYHYHRH